MKKTSCFALLIILLIASCKQPQALVYQATQNFSVQKVGLKQTEISMDVRLYNPNNYRIKLKNADVDVLINGNKVGKMGLKERFSIPNRDTFSLPVRVEVNLLSAFPNALQILFNGQMDVRLNGTLKAGRHGIFITLPVNYDNKQDLRSGIKI